MYEPIEEIVRKESNKLTLKERKKTMRETIQDFRFFLEP